MKNLFARSFALVVLAGLALGSTAQAQRIEKTIKANIPFEFAVGDKLLPAGTYSLVSSPPVFLDLRNADGRTVARVITNSVETLQAPVSPTLEFNSEDGRYSLARVWQENFSIGQQLRLPKALAKLTGRHSAGTVTVAATNSR
jgi:hypothetical protein